MGTPSLVHGQVQSARWSDHRTGNKGFLDGTSGLPRRRDGEMAQDERRAIFEEDSHHIAIGLEYLPAIARRLYHCRDLGEPFDFLTWFEYAPADAAPFDQLVARLHKTREWDYVEREIDIRL